jgi:hypothetical protein
MRTKSSGTALGSFEISFAPVAETSNITHFPNIDPLALTMSAGWRTDLRVDLRFSILIGRFSLPAA